MKEPFIHPLYIIDTLEEAGYEAYFVGGAVRDLILNRKIGDVDIATSARPDQVMKLFPKTIHVGMEHGTVVVVHENEMYEVTTFRSEGEYNDFRRPSSVTFISSLVEDLQRRDFTINAMAMNRKGEIIDPFNGREDLRNQLIRTVGDAKARFHEDALRMMRAVRFVSQLAFSLADQTKRAIQQHGSLLKHVSVERITIEFEKMLSGKRPSLALALVADTKLYRFLPGLDISEARFREVCSHDWMMLQRISECWTLLVYLLQVEDEQRFFKEWKLSNKRIKEIQLQLIGLREVINEGWSKQILYSIGQEASVSVNRILQLLRSEHYVNEHNLIYQYNQLPIHSIKDLAVNGQDLMTWMNKSGGPWLSKLLHEIERKVIENDLQNTQTSIKEWLLSCNRI
ncbi:CCA tRNA nucleotidyltransferase [Priestia megaterium]|nr:CCA tRNA nucleotidyltransferase [Priestia megaterium]